MESGRCRGRVRRHDGVLAALEVLVHYVVLPRDFVLTEIQVPAEIVIEAISGDALPKNWREPAGTAATRERGKQWVKAGRSAVLSVPSVVIPTERLYVFNPRHSDFAR